VRYRRPVPGWLRCWGFAAVAAVLANVVNNLPATLVLVLAVLIGVNIGPYLTCVGSLSNLLWRSVYASTGGVQRRRIHQVWVVHGAHRAADSGAGAVG
jgi:Na+/H+ antiporter NhaD/arsenite permease-like protein